MNFISRIIGTTGSGQQKKELAVLAPGEFYIVRAENSPKGQRECIFREAELMLLQTSVEFCYQILVRSLGDDDDDDASSRSRNGEHDDLDSSFDGLDERQYLVDAALQIGFFLSNGRTVVAWQDMSGDPGDRFEFVCAESVDNDALDEFDAVALRGMYARKYNKWPQKDSNLDEFRFDEVYTNPGPEKDSDNDDPTDQPAPISIEESKGATVNGLELRPFAEGRIMAQEQCDLCVFDATREVFVTVEKDVLACLLDQNSYEYRLDVRNAKAALLSVEIDESLNPYVSVEEEAVIFNHTNADGVLLSYLLKFGAEDKRSKFEETLTIAIWESQNRQRWGKVSQEDQKYIVSAFANATLDDASDVESEEEPEDEIVDEPMTDVTDFNDTDGRRSMTVRNSAMEVGHIKDRTYVVRGNQIGVFKHTDKSVQYSTTINDVVTPYGEELDPSKVLLHEGDNALVIQGSKDPNRLYRLDLEIGKVVDEWDMGDKSIKDFAPVSKFAQSTAEQQLMGLGAQSLFRIDPRISGAKVVDSSAYNYKTKTQLSVLATTESGFVVVGSEKGDIRLYDNLGRAARTHLPSLGRPILGIDVSADGKLVLATCEDYLILVKTVTDTGNAFTSRIAKDRKPQPILLRITPENDRFMRQQTGKAISFTPARFNTGPDAKVASIVSSTGPYLITWNLARVIKGDKSAYLVKRYDSAITAENFKFGTDKRVLVTLEDDVAIVSRSAMRKPNQKTL